MENNSFLRWLTPWRLVAILGIFFIIFLIYHLRWTMLPFWLALFVAYATSPILDRLAKTRLHRGGGVAILLSGVLIILVLFFIYFIPALAHEFTRQRDEIPRYLAAIKNFNDHSVTPFFTNRLHMETPFSTAAVEALVQEKLQLIMGKAAGFLNGGIHTAINGTIGLFQFLLDVVLFLLFLVACWLDFPRMKLQLKELIPPRYQDKACAFAIKINETLSHFLRGQFTVALILAGLYTLGLTILQVKMSIFLGILSGILFLIPYVGIAVAVGTTVTISLLNFTGWGQIVGILLLYIIMPTLETLFLTPRITGSKLTLSPAVVILAILICSELFGFWGLIFALPLTAILKMLLIEGLALYKESAYYKNPAKDNITK